MRRFLHAAAALLALAPAVANAQLSSAEYAQHRQALAAKLPHDAVVVALGAHEPPQDYLSFWQSPSFAWLTGYLEPDATLVMIRHGDSLATSLFVEPRDPAREVWTGHRFGPEGATKLTGIAARPAAQARAVLDSVAALGIPVFFSGDFPGFQVEARRGFASADQQLVASLRAQHPALAASVAEQLIMPLRGHKSDAELALIRKAVDVTVRAQREAMRAAEPGMNEFELQALIEYTFRRNGADRPSFATIVGSGPNSTTLHYNADDRRIAGGDMIVMDIGASYQGYAADVTRSIPANGRYSPAQRDIYTVVRAAQAAAERQAKLGAPARLMSDSSAATLAAGLARLGLIDSASATYDCGNGAACPQYRLYYMHGIGHGIGLEVHDPDQFYFSQVIAPGSAFTIEPGIYVRADVLDVLPDTPANRALATRLRAAVNRYANVGVRIEDDYLATDRGVEWISRAPREMDEIEALMRAQWAGPAPRDSALVNAYPGP